MLQVICDYSELPPDSCGTGTDSPAPTPTPAPTPSPEPQCFLGIFCGFFGRLLLSIFGNLFN